MSPEAATLAAAGITVAGSIFAVYIQRQLSREKSAKEQNPLEDAPPDQHSRGIEPKAVDVPSKPVTRVERITSQGILRCGCVKHPPLSDFSYNELEWEFDGLYVQMARMAAKSYGVKADFTGVPWNELSDTFGPLNLDLVLSVFETRQRLAYADFVGAFHKIGVGAVARTGDDRVQSISDLQRADVRIVVAKGEVGWEYAVHELGIPKHRLIIVENASLPELIDYVVTGTATVAICDDVSCHEGVAQHEGLNHLFANDPLYLCKNSIMVPKGDPAFAGWVDDLFSRARRTPEITAIEDRILQDAGGLIRKFR